jgi:hypothetical protein
VTSSVSAAFRLRLTKSTVVGDGVVVLIYERAA